MAHRAYPLVVAATAVTAEIWQSTGVSSLADEEPYTGKQDAEVTIRHDGDELGSFELRSSRRDPGQYQTRHIFTAVGEYETVLSFRKGEEDAVHTVDFNFRIGNRADLEIPKRKGSGT